MANSSRGVLFKETQQKELNELRQTIKGSIQQKKLKELKKLLQKYFLVLQSRASESIW